LRSGTDEILKCKNKLNEVVCGPQVELNLSAYEATKHAVLLARLVRDLKIHFNKKFTALRVERKEQVEKCEATNVSQVLGLEYDFELEDVINCTKVENNWFYLNLFLLSSSKCRKLRYLKWKQRHPMKAKKKLVAKS
jgi:hypothetical protein